MPHESFRVLVVDAATTVGRTLVQYLAETEYEVRALVTDPDDEHAAIHAGADDVVAADLLGTSDLSDIVDDVDAICCSVSDGGRRYLYGALDAGTGLRNLIDALTDSDPYVILHSRIGVGDSKPGMVLPLRILTYRVRQALQATERYLRETGIPHTILRTGRVTNGDPAGSGTVSIGAGDDATDVQDRDSTAASEREETVRDADASDSAINHLGNDDFTIELEDFIDPDDAPVEDATDDVTSRSPRPDGPDEGPAGRDQGRTSAHRRDETDDRVVAEIADPRHSHDVVTATGGDTVSGPISRTDLAWLMAAALTTPEARNRTFEVVDATAATTTDGVDFRWCGPETGLVARRSGYSIPS